MVSNAMYIYHEDNGFPPRINEGSIGIDLSAYEDTWVTVSRHKLILLNGWIKFFKDGSIDLGRWSMLVPRSSLFKRYGIIVVNSPGIIDPNYCGPDDQLALSVTKLPDEDGGGAQNILIRKGEYIAQIIPMAMVNPPFICIKSREFMAKTLSRGGFGSTGGYQDGQNAQ